MKKNGKLQGLLRTIGEYALSVGVFIALCWIYVAVKHVPAYILPSPPKVWSSLVKMFVKGTVYAHLWTTTYEVILGFVIGAFLGIVLGYVFIKIDALKTMLMPYLIFLPDGTEDRTCPVIRRMVRNRTRIKGCSDHIHGPVPGIVGNDAGFGIDPAGCQKPDEDLKSVKMAGVFTG